MGKTLVVVESPAKAKTIKKYLGNGYEVLASKGHVKDLPKRMGIDVTAGFRETYEVIEAKAKVLSELKSKAKLADTLLLATDPDREGEAIAWHLAEELTRPGLEVLRVEFHEITKKGVAGGLAKPRALDADLYDAQRARRVLDRIVGYDVSALVWSKLAFGLSAGRVQSVALRLVVDREREIEAFVAEEYWNIAVSLRTPKGGAFQARLTAVDGAKADIKAGDKANQLKADLDSANYRVLSLTRREQRRNAPAPYTTSKLQQDASAYLRYPTRRTMSVAQRLYEGIDLKKDGGPVGLITYMRTDSVRVSLDAIDQVRVHIEGTFGAQYVPPKPNQFKSRKSAQEAHEAIRPTSLEFAPEVVRKHLTDEQYRLYKLIWDRFVASQMAAAIYNQTSLEVEAVPARKSPSAQRLILRANGRSLAFSGWLEQYQHGKSDKPFGEDAPRELAGEEEGSEPDANGREAATPTSAESRTADEDVEATLPEMNDGDALKLVSPPGVLAEQKFTQPPPRFNEGSLVRELERRGIGRPSTYSEIISKVQARDYVEKLSGGQMKATDLGKVVVDGLVSTSLDFIEPSFTAKMEEELDEVEAGNLKRVSLLERFYDRFRATLDTAKKQKRWTPEPIPTGENCPKCGADLHRRWSKNGWFIGCSGYPKCKFTQSLNENGGAAEPKPTEHICDKCGKFMVIRTGRYGEFLACSGYPECKNARPMPLGIACPKCGRDVIEVRGKKRGKKSFYGCAGYPECDFKLWQKPVAEACPQCASPYLLRMGGEKNPKLICPDKACGFSRKVETPEAEESSPDNGQQSTPSESALYSTRRSSVVADSIGEDAHLT
jgi:DNA topoisomerase-1